MSTTPTPAPPNKGLSVTGAIETSLTLLEAVLASIPGTEVEAEVVALIESAVAKLSEVTGSPTTFGQLEGLRIQKLF